MKSGHIAWSGSLNVEKIQEIWTFFGEKTGPFHTTACPEPHSRSLHTAQHMFTRAQAGVPVSRFESASAVRE